MKMIHNNILFFEKVEGKKILKVKNVQMAASKRFVEIPLICFLRCLSCVLLCFNLYSLNFAITLA